MNRGQQAVEAAKTDLLKALNDDSPYVRITAGYALGKFGDADASRRGVDCLIQVAPWTTEGDVFASIAAQNAIDKLDKKALPALDAIKAFPRKGGASPDARFNGYVDRLLQKTLADLEPAKPSTRRKQRN